MTEDKIVHNETLGYVLKQMANIEEEMVACQSALLASGFLEFDANRLASELNAIVSTLLNEKPVDYPETHPHPVD